jgi:hypothetical protein
MIKIFCVSVGIIIALPELIELLGRGALHHSGGRVW